MPVVVPDSPCPESHGCSLHAGMCIEGHDRDRLERLCRYVPRPALSQAHLMVPGDGKVPWELSNPWRAGTRAFVFDPLAIRKVLLHLMLRTEPREPRRARTPTQIRFT